MWRGEGCQGVRGVEGARGVEGQGVKGEEGCERWKGVTFTQKVNWYSSHCTAANCRTVITDSDGGLQVVGIKEQ